MADKLSRDAESPTRLAAGAPFYPEGHRRQGGQGGETAKPSYWAVLPAAIRYDPALPANAKLLYAEISALTDQRGYCWASNAYFEALYSLSERTIVRLIRALEKAGYIRILDAGGGATRRKIAAGINPLGAATSFAAGAAPSPQGEGYPPPPSAEPPFTPQGTGGKGAEAETPDKNVSTPLTKMSVPPDKNVTQNKRENRKENNPPKAPQGAGADIWDKPAWDRFWAMYPRKVDKAKAIRAWNKLKADRKLMQIMSAALKAQRASEEWRRDNGRAIPYPSTWLNNRRWEDEVTESPTGSAGAPFYPEGHRRQGGRENGEDGDWL